jgi:hypothetical protein
MVTISRSSGAGRMDREEFEKMAAMFPRYFILWWQYKEAGTYDGYVTISGTDTNKILFVAPEVTKPTTIHIILKTRDIGSPSLTAFARVIITVLPA